MSLESSLETYVLNNGSFDYDFYNEYLRSNAHPYCNNAIDKLKEDYDDIVIDYFALSFKGNHEYTYSELWLIDINLPNNKYFPIFINEINSSSPYAMMRSTMVPDEIEKEITKSNIMDLITDKVKKEILENLF